MENKIKLTKFSVRASYNYQTVELEYEVEGGLTPKDIENRQKLAIALATKQSDMVEQQKVAKRDEANLKKPVYKPANNKYIKGE